MIQRGDPVLVVRGLKGFLAGEERELHVGDVLVIGRSRSADLSLRAARRFLMRTDQEQVMESEAFKSVSRKHTRIQYLHPGLVEVKDLSSNGTFVDGRKVDVVALTDFRDGGHVVTLGASERVLLEIPAYKELGVDTEVRPDD
ncbi:MAG: FHA domain-containing protein [Planctomycetota bacterium]